MKKLFYLLFLITLCFTFNFKINAENIEEIDCDTHPYACVKCTYGTLEFTAYSDGTNITLIKPENSTTGSYLDRIHQNFDKIFSSHFQLMEENKLACPGFIFYNDTFPPEGKTREYNFNVDTEQYKIKLNKEINNKKNMYKDNVETLSCTYNINDTDKVIITTDGTNVTYSSNKYEVSGNVGAGYFKDAAGNLQTEENCPTLHFYCIGSENGQLAGKYYCNVYSSPQNLTRPIEGSSTTTGDDLSDALGFLDGSLYKHLLGSLKMPLENINTNVLNFTLRVGSVENESFGNIKSNNALCSKNENDCINNANYLAEQGLKNIRSYCNDIYASYANSSQDIYIDERMQECISFNSFYSTLVNEGIVNNLADYCGILSKDFVEKLSFFLSIIMIAGPILAILLGSVDFIKVITNGDADKEMKTAFKHFMIRVGSAALLFLIPALLSFILSTFSISENQDNPFCNVNDWSEQ